MFPEHEQGGLGSLGGNDGGVGAGLKGSMGDDSGGVRAALQCSGRRPLGLLSPTLAPPF
jgi:hypothetical protein